MPFLSKPLPLQNRALLCDHYPGVMLQPMRYGKRPRIKCLHHNLKPQKPYVIDQAYCMHLRQPVHDWCHAFLSRSPSEESGCESRTLRRPLQRAASWGSRTSRPQAATQAFTADKASARLCLHMHGRRMSGGVRATTLQKEMKWRSCLQECRSNLLCAGLRCHPAVGLTRCLLFQGPGQAVKHARLTLRPQCSGCLKTIPACTEA